MIKYNQQRIRGKLQSHCPLKVVIPILLIELIKLRNNFESWFSVSVPFFSSIFESRNIIMWSNKNGTWVTWSGWQPLQLLLCVSLVTWWYIENRQSKLTMGVFVLENFLNVFRCRMKLLEWFLVNTHDTDLSFLFHIMG